MHLLRLANRDALLLSVNDKIFFCFPLAVLIYLLYNYFNDNISIIIYTKTFSLSRKRRKNKLSFIFSGTEISYAIYIYFQSHEIFCVSDTVEKGGQYRRQQLVCIHSYTQTLVELRVFVKTYMYMYVSTLYATERENEKVLTLRER